MNATEATITEQRELKVERATGSSRWQVTEFRGGESYMLTAGSSSLGFDAHFTGEQWHEFQRLIAGEKS